MPQYTYYDPAFILGRNAIGLDKYPDSVHSQTRIVALITKESMVRAVDVTDRVAFNVFSEECCQGLHHTTKATMKLYALPRSVLNGKGSNEPILERAIDLEPARVGGGRQ